MKVLLFSGGIDSACIAYWTKPSLLVHIDYGQVCAKGELRAAHKLSEELGIKLECLKADCADLGSGQMANRTVHYAQAPEFWPYRNQLLITLIAMRFYEIKDLAILIGSVKSDAVHSDGTKQFYTEIQRVLGVQGNAKIETPALELSSSELIAHSEIPRNLLGWCYSCHSGEYACGQCRGCQKQNEVIHELR